MYNEVNNKEKIEFFVSNQTKYLFVKEYKTGNQYQAQLLQNIYI